MRSTADNPAGTDGLEFVEFATLHPPLFIDLLTNMGFTAIAKHRSKEVLLFRQGKINFILNNEPGSHAMEFAKEHGPCACALAFRVKNANAALERAMALGAKPYLGGTVNKSEQMIPAIYGIDGSLLYFVDHYQNETIYDTDFIPFKGVHQYPEGKGLIAIDHLTHNEHRGNVDEWLPIQHIALSTYDIYRTVESLRANHVRFLPISDTYYERINERIKNHHETIDRMRQNHILMDGEVNGDKVALLLQIFTENVIGSLFFEIIQRKGNEGFGESHAR